MCGIALSYRSSPGAEAWTEAMCARIKHRGPDDEGYLGVRVTLQEGEIQVWGGGDTPQEVLSSDFPFSPKEKSGPRGKSSSNQDGETARFENAPGFSVSLGHRRLSILDLSPGGHEPICTRDRKTWLSFNGEIYNYIELREELKKLGHEFLTVGDAEVILASYREWGKECFRKFEGMFALAILDLSKKELVLARDPFGIKPLYWTRLPDGIAAASEAKAFFALPGWKPRVSARAAYAYLVDAVVDHGDLSFYEGVYQIPAGALATIPLRDGKIQEPAIGKYWDVWKQGSRKLSPLSFEAAADRLREIFLQSVRLHLRSDVPVGSCLSGGIDSSAIVMAMREVGGRDFDLHCFGFIPDDPAISEEKWMRLVAQKAGAKLDPVRISAGDLKRDLDPLILSQDFPFTSTSMYAQYRVFQSAREAGIKVMLDGQGGDELFAGYFHYISSRLRSLVLQGEFSEGGRLTQKALELPGTSSKELLGRAVIRMLPGFAQKMARNLGGATREPDWLNLSWFSDQGIQDDRLRREKQGSTNGDREYLKQHLCQAIEEISLPQLLRYEDRNSMSHSIESRVPFLIPRLAEFALSLPEEFLISPQATTKAVFRKAMRGIVPDEILDRKDKIGFKTPESAWMTELGDWVDSILASERAHQIPALCFQEMQKEWKSIQSGKQRLDFRVWRWVNLIRWSELNEVEW